MPMNDSLPWPPVTWVKHNDVARRPQDESPPQNHRIFRVLAERHQRLWVHHAGGKFLLDYEPLLRQLPHLPSWEEWCKCWVADGGACVRWPSGLQQQFGTELNFPAPVILHELSHDQEIFRPLRDQYRDGKMHDGLNVVRLLYKITDEQIELMVREYAAPHDLVLKRLADLARYVQVQHLVNIGQRRPSPAGMSKSKKYFLEYIGLPPREEWLRAQYPTRLSLILAGGIHLIEQEWLSGQYMKRPLDAKSRVL